MGRRAKMDPLYRLVKSLPLGIFEQLYGVKRTDGPTKKTGRQKLLHFTYHSPGFDAAELKSTFKDYNLAALKYDTKHWVIEELKRMGAYPNHDLLDLMRTIEVMAARGDTPEVFEVIEKAKALCLERELPMLLLHLQDFETDILQRTDLAEIEDSRFGNLATLDAEIAATEQRLMILGSLKATKRRYYMPLQRQYEKEDRCDPVKVEALSMALAAMNEEIVAQSPRAHSEYLSQLIFVSWRKGAHRVALQRSQQLVTLADAHPHLIEEDFKGYLMNLQTLIGFLGSVGERELAYEFMERLERLVLPAQGGRGVGLEKLLYAKFYLWDTLDDAAEGEEAVEILSAHLNYIQQEIESRHGTWLCFFAGSYRFSKGAYLEAYQYFEIAFSIGNGHNKPDEVVYARLMMLLALFGRSNDFEDIAREAKNTLRFLDRAGEYPVARTIAGLLMRLPIIAETKEATDAAIHESKIRLIELKEDQANQHHFGYHDFFTWLDNVGIRLQGLVQSR
jgi:hypothetical protein